MDNGECVFIFPNFSEEIQSRVLNCKKRYGKGVLIFGDSHAKDIFNSYQYLNKNDFLLGISANFCQAHKTIDHCYFKELSNGCF